MVTISSAGTVLADASIKKIIKVQMGIPSFAKYAWILNSNVVFGSTAQVYGMIDSNGGIQFDGAAHNLWKALLPPTKTPATATRTSGLFSPPRHRRILSHQPRCRRALRTYSWQDARLGYPQSIYRPHGRSRHDRGDGTDTGYYATVRAPSVRSRALRRRHSPSTK